MAVPTYAPFSYYIDSAAQRFGVDPRLIRGAMALENYGGDPRLTGSSGEVGLMQVMGPTYAALAQQHGLGDDRTDPENNIMAGTAYLREGLDAGGGDWGKALAYYNAGPGGASSFLKTGDFSSLPAVTQEHLRRGMRLGLLDPSQSPPIDVPARPPAQPVQEAQPMAQSIPMPQVAGLLADPSGGASAQPAGGGMFEGLLGGGDWKTALAASMMALGEGLRGGNPANGLAMLQNLQKQQQAQALQKFVLGRFGMQGGGAPAAGGAADAASAPGGGGGTGGGIGGGGTGGMAGGGVKPLSPQELVALKMMGVDLTDINKQMVEGFSIPTGAIQVDAVTGQRRYIPKVGEGKTLDLATGTVGNVPGAVASDAEAAAAKAAAETAARYRVDQSPSLLGIPNKAADTMLSATGTNAANAPKDAVTYAKGLREEFAANPVVRNRHEAVTAYRGIEDAAKRDSLPSDLNMVYGIAKLMDPGSVVREGETLMVNNTQALGDKILGAIRAINGGAKLTPDTRAALLDEARSRVAQHEQAYGDLAGTYHGIATRLGLNPADVIPGMPLTGPAAPVKPAALGGANELHYDPRTGKWSR